VSDEINELKLLLAQLNTVVAVNDEKLVNKLEKVEFLEKIATRDAALYAAIGKVNDRINGIYLKVAGASGIIVGAIELVASS
jgi:hypothetical protein